jgi:hypothetical protein
MQPPAIPSAALERLHESVLPPPVSWVPQAPGWYVVLGLALFAAGLWTFATLQRHKRQRYRRSALDELAVIERSLLLPGGRAEALTAVAVLLKRTALAAFPRAEVASLAGDAWLSFLDRTMGAQGFTEGDGRLLAELAYAPGARLSQLPDDSVAGLLRLARRWISSHTA